jgi:glycosyltransferase involved in cell wall biosynthesis
MISILIPVYNYDITSFINCLSGAIEDSEFYNEIIIGADGCDKSFIDSYQKLALLPGVKLHISEENIGRASIRNQLAEKSTGSHLLYIDADALAQPNVREFLLKYVDHLGVAPVICGGTSYREVPPDDPDRYLRWHYGYYRERPDARRRNKAPMHHSPDLIF